MTALIDINKIIEADATPADEIKTVLSSMLDAFGRVETVTLTAAQMLALNATPITVVAAPAAGYMHIIDSLELYKPAGTAYAGIAAGEDIALRYTNGSGTILIQSEATGFLDQTTAQVRVVKPAVTEFAPTAAAAIVAHMTTGEITTGDSPVSLRISYRTVPTTF